MTTTDATIGDVLGDLDITVGKDDRLSVAQASAVLPNEVVTLQRVRKELSTRTETVHYRTVKRDDSSLFKGVTKVVHAGRDGKARVTYALVYIDGVLTARTAVHRTTLDRRAGARPRHRYEAGHHGAVGRPLEQRVRDIPQLERFERFERLRAVRADPSPALRRPARAPRRRSRSRCWPRAGGAMTSTTAW